MPTPFPFPDVTVVYGDLTLPDQARLDRRFTREDREAVDRMLDALSEVDGISVTPAPDHEAFRRRLSEDPPPFVLNFCDTGFRNDPTHELHVPALMEVAGVPYSGAGPACLGLCYDKGLVRAIAEAYDVPVPREQFLPAGSPSLPESVAFPALVKPATGDGSVGITSDSVVSDDDQLGRYVRRLQDEYPERDILVQEYLSGPEYTVGLLGPALGAPKGALPEALPLLDVDYSGLDPSLPPILAFESKAVADSPYWNQIQYRNADVSDETRDDLVRWAQTLYRRLGCRDYARIDFRCDAQGTPRLLEVNPNPAWCWDGKMNLMAGFAGWTYAQFLERIVQAAQHRVAGADA